MSQNILAIIIVAIGCGTGILITFMCLIFGAVGKRKKRGETLGKDEGKILQDLWEGIQKMENRVENLETILISQQKQRDFERKL
jgi:phage shock protein B